MTNRIHRKLGPVTHKEQIEGVARNLLTIAEVVLSTVDDFNDFDETDLEWFQEKVSEENYVLERLYEDWKAQ